MSFDPSKYICVDVETSGIQPEFALQPWRAPTDAWLSSIAYQHGDQKKVILSPTKDDIRKMLSYALDNDLTLLAWNSTFDVAWLIAYGFDEEVHRLKHADGMLLHKHLHNSPGHTISHGLKATVKAYYPDEAGYEEDIEFFTTDADKLKQLAEYNLKDVEFTLRLTEQIYNDLTPEQRNAAAIEAECIPLIAYANYAGLKVDVDAAQSLKTKLEAKALALLQELSPDGVTEKIIRSPAQLNTLLFETWGLPKLKGDSTDKEALHELAHIDPRAKKLRELREALNLKTKFVEALIESADYNGDNTTHPQAIIFGTYSGRLTYSSTQGRGKDQRQTGFAIHQMKRDKEFRKIIKAPDGYTLVEFDAASQEYRLQAILSNDKQMLELCKGKDPHQYMADQIGEGTARQLGKVANLSLAYRTSAPKLKSVARVQYNIPMEIEEAKNIHAAYQQAYPGMVRYWDKQITKGKTKRSVDTLAGRRLHLDGDWNNDAWALGSSAINYPIQGTGADQKYLALSVLKPYLREINARFAFDLHDGIYLLIPTEKVSAAIEQIKLLLDNLPYEQAWGFTPAIPLPFDCKAGPSWGAMEEVVLKSAGAGPDQETSPNLTALPAIVGGVTSERDLERSTDTNRPAAVITQVNFQPPNEQACELALEYARNGVKVFPCQSDKTPVTVGYTNEGNPIGFAHSKNSSYDPDTIKRWFLEEYKSSARMVGIPCGANGLVVIDTDAPKPEKQRYIDGRVAFQNLATAVQIDLTNVPAVDSPSGGRHYFFAQPDGHHLGNTTGQLPENIDVRGDGGYIIAPGSVRFDGKAYAAAPNSPQLLDAILEAAVPPIPQQLIDIIGRKATNTNAEAELLPKAILLEALLETNIPNDEYFHSRERWVEMAHAIFGASQGEPWARRAWLAWSAQRDQKPGEPERVWDSIKPNAVRAGAGFIRKQLEDRGRVELLTRAKTAQAQSLFDKVDGSDQPIHVEDPDAPIVGFVFDGEAIPEPPPALIEDLIYADGINWIGGQSGAGKTFIAVDMAVALATGQSFLGREIKERVASIYIAAEGRASILARIAGSKTMRFLDQNSLPIAVAVDAPLLNDPKEAAKFKLLMKRVAAKLTNTSGLRVGAIFIDTMAAAFEIDDENAAAQMQKVARWMLDLASSIGAAAIPVHHYGKDATTGLRGSSSNRAAGESVIAVLGADGETSRHVLHEKNRHGVEGAKFHFEIESTSVVVEGRDDPIDTAGVRFKDEGQAKGPNRRDATDTNIRVLKAVANNPDGSMREWAEIVGANPSSISRALKRMAASRPALVKYVEPLDKWSITKEGAKQIK